MKIININSNNGISKITIIIAIISLILLCSISFFVIINKNVNENISAENSELENNDTTNRQNSTKNNSLIIEGVEYIDSSRDFEDVTLKKFSFLINNDRTKYLTYIDNEENSQIDVNVIQNTDGSVGITFSHKKYSIMIADKNYTINNKNIITDSKKLLFDENNLKCYIDDYSSTNYIYQFITEIDGVETYIYGLSKTFNDEKLKESVKTIINKLSVNKNVGFYIDHYLSYEGLDGIALKSYKLVGSIKIGGSAMDDDKLILNGVSVDYHPTMHSWSSTEMFDDNKVYGEIGDRKVGYSLSDKELIIYIYNSKTEDGKELFLGVPQVVMVYKYEKLNMKPEDIVKLFVDNLITY